MRLRTLGGLELEGTRFRRPKPLLVLAYLALEGPQERGHLAELFFRGSKRARANLSVVLSRLRRGAPGAVGTDDRSVWTAVQTDVRRLLTALERGDLERGSRLYGGRFLEGVKLDGVSGDIEEWLHGVREFVASQVQRAQLAWAEAAAAEGRFGLAAERAERAYKLASAVPEPDTLERLHTLLLAGNKLAEAKLREEAAFFELSLCRSAAEARERLRGHSGRADLTGDALPTRETSIMSRGSEPADMSRLSERRLVKALELSQTGPGSGWQRRINYLYDIVFGFAELWESRGELPKAVEAFSFVLHNSSTPRPFRLQSQQALARLRPRLDEVTFENASERGRSARLEATVEWVLKPGPV